jgi:tetratricopeptide (TPR) repeat protein
LGLFGGDPQKKKNVRMVKEVRRMVKAKRYGPALKTGIEYLREVPENHDILFIVGGIYYMQKRYASALPYFERALKIGRYDTEVLALKAQCHRRLGQKSRAEECWRDILEVDPKNAEALEMLGG